MTLKPFPGPRNNFVLSKSGWRLFQKVLRRATNKPLRGCARAELWLTVNHWWSSENMMRVWLRSARVGLRRWLSPDWRWLDTSFFYGKKLEQRNENLLPHSSQTRLQQLKASLVLAARDCPVTTTMHRCVSPNSRRSQLLAKRKHLLCLLCLARIAVTSCVSSSCRAFKRHLGQLKILSIWALQDGWVIETLCQVKLLIITQYLGSARWLNEISELKSSQNY